MKNNYYGSWNVFLRAQATTINRTTGILRRQAETYIFTFTGSLGACIVLAIRE